MVDACVSVIIPTYNRRDYVQEAIDSVLAQRYTNYEIIVIDDGSTDGTGEALRARYGDRIRYEWQENQGESVARNRGIELARGEFVAFLDSDDLWFPRKLGKQVEFMEANPGVGMVFSQAWAIDEVGDRIPDLRLVRDITSDDLTLERLCFDCPMSSGSSTGLVRKSILDASGGFDPAIRYGEDEDLWVRIRLLTDIRFLPDALACMRRHKQSQSYYPSSEQNSQRLAAYLATREKLFSAWSEAPEGLHQQAVAWQYAKASLREALSGDEQAARACLKEAAKHNTRLLTDYVRFGTEIAGQVARFYERGDKSDVHSALSLLHFLLTLVGDFGYYDQTFARKTRAACYKALGFTANRMRDNAAVLYCFPRALILNPSLANNRGILSMLLAATLPEKLFAACKELYLRLSKRRAVSRELEG